MKGIALYNSDFLSVKSNKNLIYESITRILLTEPGERVMSQFGCNLKRYLFEQANVFQSDVEDEVKRAIERWEPRVSVVGVLINTSIDNTAYIFIQLIIRETLEELNYETTLRY